MLTICCHSPNIQWFHLLFLLWDSSTGLPGLDNSTITKTCKYALFQYCVHFQGLSIIYWPPTCLKILTAWMPRIPIHLRRELSFIYIVAAISWGGYCEVFSMNWFTIWSIMGERAGRRSHVREKVENQSLETKVVDLLRYEMPILHEWSHQFIQLHLVCWVLVTQRRRISVSPGPSRTKVPINLRTDICGVGLYFLRPGLHSWVTLPLKIIWFTLLAQLSYCISVF